MTASRKACSAAPRRSCPLPNSRTVLHATLVYLPSPVSVGSRDSVQSCPAQAASVVQAYPLVGTLFGLLLFREYRGVSRTAQLLLAAQASPGFRPTHAAYHALAGVKCVPGPECVVTSRPLDPSRAAARGHDCVQETVAVAQLLKPASRECTLPRMTGQLWLRKAGASPGAWWIRTLRDADLAQHPMLYPPTPVPDAGWALHHGHRPPRWLCQVTGVADQLARAEAQQASGWTSAQHRLRRRHCVSATERDLDSEGVGDHQLRQLNSRSQIPPSVQYRPIAPCMM